MNNDHVTNGVNLVWTTQGLGETDWLRYLLDPLIKREVVAERFEFIEPRSIYVVSANRNLRKCLPPEFIAKLANVPGKGLIHLSDEYYAGGYDLYREFDFVLRMHHAAWIADIPEVLIFPAGWKTGMPHRTNILPATARKYVWSFSGNRKASSRPEMFKALDAIKPKYVNAFIDRQPGARNLSQEEYHAVLDDTVFAPCPMGNAVMETWRFYEALEAGCIPIIEVRPWMHYHERLLGPHPIPIIYRWSQAATLINDLLADPERLKTLQHSITSWWTQCKKSNKDRINSFISEKLEKQDSKLSTRSLPSTSPLWPIRRTIELLRHQSGMSLFRRVKRPFVRLISKH
jgi:hypothetical protein